MGTDSNETSFGKLEDNGVRFVNTGYVARIKLDGIPEWLLVEVLIRLPVKLVFRSKLVSKQWLSVISDPYFVRMYISRASTLPQLQPWTFIYNTMRVQDSKYLDYLKQESLVDIHSSDLEHPSFYELSCPCTEQDPRGTRYKIVGVSNGLVLYGPYDQMLGCIDDFRIGNPTTGQWIRLPPHGRLLRYVSVGFLTRAENGILTSYKVVCLSMALTENNMIRFVVFLSEIGEWKEFAVYTDHQKIQVDWYGTPTSLNGILLWITLDHGIIAYDPYTKPDYLRIIALPGDRGRKDIGIRSFCDAHQGRLRYLEVFDDSIFYHEISSFGIWILNDYSTGEWCLQHRMSYFDFFNNNNPRSINLRLHMVSFHPFASDIMYFGYENIIVSYNIKSRKLEAVKGFEGQHIRKWPLWLQTFLLMIPPWPTYIPPPSFGVMED